MRNRPIILVLALLQTVGCWSSWSRTDGGATDGSTDDSPDSPPCTPRLADRETYYQLVSDEPPYPHVDLAWTDDRWLFVYRTDPGLPLHGLWYIGMFPDGSLQVVGHVPGSESCHHPLAVWNGETALITCDNDTGRVEIESRERSVDPYESLGSARLVHPEDEVVWGIQSALAWTGTHAVVAWPYQTTGPNADGVAVQFLEGDGTRHGSPVRLADGYTGHPDVQGLDGRAAVLWLGGSTYLSIIEPDGTIVSQTEVGSDATIGRHLAVGPHAMAMVWSEDGFHFRLLDLDGVPSGEPVEVAGRNAATASAAIDWTVWGWAIVWQSWQSIPSGEDSEMRLLVLDDTGRVVADHHLDSIPDGELSEPHLDWSGSELGIAWVRQDAGGSRVRFTRLVCD